MPSSNSMIHSSIMILLLLSFVAGIIAIYTLSTNQHPCGNTYSPPLLYYYYSKSELTLISLETACVVIAIILCFLVYINNFKVLSILVGIALLVMASLVMANAVDLSKDQNPAISAKYDISSGIAVPALFGGMSVAIISCVLVFYYYGQNFVKDVRNFI